MTVARMTARLMRRLAVCRDGQALVEAAVTIPILLLLSAGIFEFGRAYQTWEVLTNAAREGARIAVLPNPGAGAVEARVRGYMESGQLSNYASAAVTVDRNAALSVNGSTVSASQVTVNYPFDFIVLQPVARLVSRQSQTGASLTMVASALMRNEAQ
jgi:Flp pilus assembly protein TadG